MIAVALGSDIRAQVTRDATEAGDRESSSHDSPCGT